MKTVLFSLLSFMPFLVIAQPGHWRYSLNVGQAKPFTHLITEKPIEAGRLTINSPAGVSLQAALERSIRDNLSLRASIGHQQIRYDISTSYAIRDTTGQILGRMGSGSRSLGSGLTVGTLGVTLNSRTIGRTILTTGLDGVIRVNTSPDRAGQRTGGRGGGSTTVQGQTQTYGGVYEFETQRIEPVTFGLAARVGIDYRLSKRGLFSVGISYTKGFGYIRNAVSTDLQIDGVVNEGSYSSRASSVAGYIGYKHSLFRVNPLAPFQFTPYNQPELAPPRFLTPQQRQNTFTAKSWLYELRGSYRPIYDLNVLGVGGNIGYFFANRYLVGLSIDYRRYGGVYSPLSFGNLIQIGPIVRGYAGRGRVAPYLEGGYQVGWIFGGITPTRFTSSLPIAFGFSIRVSESVRLNPSYTVRYFQQKGRSDAWPGLPQLSLSFSPKPK